MLLSLSRLCVGIPPFSVIDPEVFLQNNISRQAQTNMNLKEKHFITRYFIVFLAPILSRIPKGVRNEAAKTLHDLINAACESKKTKTLATLQTQHPSHHLKCSNSDATAATDDLQLSSEQILRFPGTLLVVRTCCYLNTLRISSRKRVVRLVCMIQRFGFERRSERGSYRISFFLSVMDAFWITFSINQDQKFDPLPSVALCVLYIFFHFEIKPKLLAKKSAWWCRGV